MRTVTVSEFRKYFMAIFDEIAATGVPVLLTKRGKSLFLLESGGYEAQEESLKLEKEEERKKDEASYQKTLNEGKLAKWQVKIFWPAFIFTFIGSVLGIASFIMQLVAKSPVK